MDNLSINLRENGEYVLRIDGEPILLIKPEPYHGYVIYNNGYLVSSANGEYYPTLRDAFSRAFTFVLETLDIRSCYGEIA